MARTKKTSRMVSQATSSEEAETADSPGSAERPPPAVTGGHEPQSEGPPEGDGGQDAEARPEVGALPEQPPPVEIRGLVREAIMLVKNAPVAGDD